MFSMLDTEEKKAEPWFTITHRKAQRSIPRRRQTQKTGKNDLGNFAEGISRNHTVEVADVYQLAREEKAIWRFDSRIHAVDV